jgi:hypothetical protein
VNEHAATAPNQVWSWDITYLTSALRGSFYYLYMVEDVWSQKIVGWAIHEEESMDVAAQLMPDICMKSGVDVKRLGPALGQRRSHEELDDARDPATLGRRAVLQQAWRQR